MEAASVAVPAAGAAAVASAAVRVASEVLAGAAAEGAVLLAVGED